MGKRSAYQLAQRNGYRDRDWETRAGAVKPILLEQNDEWAVQRAHYMTLETRATLSDPVVGLRATVS